MKKTILGFLLIMILGTAAEAVSWYRAGFGWGYPYAPYYYGPYYGPYWGRPYPYYRRPVRRRVVYVQQPRRQARVRKISDTQATQPRIQQRQPVKHITTQQKAAVKKALPTLSAHTMLNDKEKE